MSHHQHSSVLPAYFSYSSLHFRSICSMIIWKIHKLGVHSVWFLSPKSLKIYPHADVWLIDSKNMLIFKIQVGYLLHNMLLYTYSFSVTLSIWHLQWWKWKEMSATLLRLFRREKVVPTVHTNIAKLWTVSVLPKSGAGWGGHDVATGA